MKTTVFFEELNQHKAGKVIGQDGEGRQIVEFEDGSKGAFYPDLIFVDYCSQNGDCNNCSLVNYGMDCHNKQLY